jgi:hypothetical protein
MHEILAFGVSRGDAAIKMFVKTDKLDPRAKVNPDPRPIQFRGPKFCVALAQFLKPIEAGLYQLRGVSKGVIRSRNIAKGLNQVERAELLVRKWQQFDDPVAVTLDASRFDKHVDRELLKVEHSVYLGVCHCAEFRLLLSWQLDNTCFSSLGMKYKTRGKRMSGDMNTALGNCLLMVLMVLAFLHWCKRWDTLDDGDDDIVLIERRDLARLLRTVHAEFLEFGMEVKVENVAHTIFDVEFCQSKIVEFAQGRYKFVRNPWKVMSCALSGVNHYQVEVSRNRLVHTIGICELILNLGIPVLQEYALAVLRNAGDVRSLELDEASSIMIRVRRELRALGLKTVERVKPQTISEVARETFALAFGMEPHNQILLESRLREWKFELRGDVRLPDEWDVPRWDQSPIDQPEVYRL